MILTKCMNLQRLWLCHVSKVDTERDAEGPLIPRPAVDVWNLGCVGGGRYEINDVWKWKLCVYSLFYWNCSWNTMKYVLLIEFWWIWDLMASPNQCWCIGHSESGSDPRIPTGWTKCCFLSAPKGFNLRFRDVERNVKQRRLLMPWCLLWFRLQVGPFKFVESDWFQLIVGRKSQFFKTRQESSKLS